MEETDKVPNKQKLKSTMINLGLLQVLTGVFLASTHIHGLTDFAGIIENFIGDTYNPSLLINTGLITIFARDSFFNKGKDKKKKKWLKGYISFSKTTLSGIFYIISSIVIPTSMFFEYNTVQTLFENMTGGLAPLALLITGGTLIGFRKAVLENNQS